MRSESFPNWYGYELLDGKLIGSEHPENLHFDPAEKRRITHQIAHHLRQDHGVRAVLNLTASPWEYGDAGLIAYHLPIPEASMDACPRELLVRAVQIIDQVTSTGGSAWVHCQRGIDRTGCVIGCYLTSLERDPESVICDIKAQWPKYRVSGSGFELWEPAAKRIREYAAAR